ncbi:MAG: oxidoreductase [Acidobacteriia bacterium]|nr:oxidoreductase [Terriglobia bacterium]
MSDLPPFIEVEDFAGEDFTEKWRVCLEELYRTYLDTVAFGNLRFRGLPVRCQFRPMTFGKHFAFWHMMQEGKIEDDRHIDLQRCRRVRWISWVIQNSENEPRIRVFEQAPRNRERSYVLWLDEEDYAVILWRRNDYYLLKTAFLLKEHKKKEFARDWEKYKSGQNG